jgi:uncharacterized protein YjbJ (UPF0337 family)
MSYVRNHPDGGWWIGAHTGRLQVRFGTPYSHHEERRHQMKPSTEDRAKGKVQEVKGKLKEQAGRITDNPDLEDEGTVEKIGGKVRQVIGKIEMAAGA